LNDDFACLSLPSQRFDRGSLNREEIQYDPLPYASSLEHRDVSSIDLVVIHCTELPDLASARGVGEEIIYPESGTGNSGHFYIEQNGRVEQWVPVERVAHHVRGYNRRSIGIELDNRGRFPDWFDSRHQRMSTPYPAAQINGLLGLLSMLSSEMPNLKNISGHEQLDRGKVPASNDPGRCVFRKRDPGPMFPWDKLLPQLGLRWYEP
jgi:N-acetylmuramoyl-L-alanine amidase